MIAMSAAILRSGLARAASVLKVVTGGLTSGAKGGGNASGGDGPRVAA
jgi:hypothetical protein